MIMNALPQQLVPISAKFLYEITNHFATYETTGCVSTNL